MITTLVLGTQIADAHAPPLYSTVVLGENLIALPVLQCRWDAKTSARVERVARVCHTTQTHTHRFLTAPAVSQLSCSI